MSSTPITTYGPLMNSISGGKVVYRSDTPGVWYPTIDSTNLKQSMTSYTQWEKWYSGNHATRVKPRNVIASPTNWDQRSRYSYRARDSSSVGNSSPSDYNAVSFLGNSETYKAETAAQQMALQRVLIKVKDQKWDLSVFLGELHETMEFALKVGTALYHSYRAVVRGDMKQLSRTVFPLLRGKNTIKLRGRLARGVTHANRDSLSYTSNYVSQRWLEWRYAVMPMMYDFQGALSALHDASVDPLFTRVSERGYGSFRSQSETIDVKATKLALVRCTHLLMFQISPNLSGFKKLGLLNPVATLWELTPLSFVADWFLPVGDYLACLDAMADVTVLANVRATKTKTKSTQQLLWGTTNRGNFVQNQSTESIFIDDVYQRVINTPLSLNLPRPQLGLNAYRLMDGMSLIRGAIRK